MQLIKKTVLILMGLTSGVTYSQTESDSSKIQLKDITISLITSYYEQDGNHSPVTGGIGTEQLTNIAPAVIINIPLDTVKSLAIDGGVDFYSSASSDNINNPYNDPNHVSGASSKDERSYINVGYKKKNNQKHSYKGFSVGLSSEYDVTSGSIGFNLSKSSKDENKTLNLKLKYYIDQWRLIYPIELRNGTVSYLPTSLRHSLNFSTSGSFNLNKRVAASITADFVTQAGLLSTPFHRVYMEGNPIATVEKLPGLRLKLPIGVRTNIHINDLLKLRLFYRFYTDNWGIVGNTVNVELPIKVGNTVRLTPFYRFHMQTAADYFGEKNSFSSTSVFHSSDYDLSALTTQKIGMGVNYQPLFGIGRMKGIFRKDKISMFKSMDLRYAYYKRSDGFKANIFTLGLNFTIPNRSINLK